MGLRNYITGRIRLSQIEFMSSESEDRIQGDFFCSIAGFGPSSGGRADTILRGLDPILVELAPLDKDLG